MRIEASHAWDLSPAEAIALQRELAQRVVRTGELADPDVGFVAGADVAFDKPNRRAIGAVVLLAYPSLEVVERVTVEVPVTFPYVPGLLSFRETPVLLEAFARLNAAPDLLMIDGHGYAHPRRFGFACHVGLLLDVPTIGVAKSRLIGEQGTVAAPRGSRADLTDGGDVIGSILRTRQGVNSVYVSVGHRISLSSAERWALACSRGYRVPEPTRLADRAAGDAKRHMLQTTLDIVIEQRAGERGRWAWVAADDAVVYQNDLPPMPTHYGCSVDIINPADGELLDVMLVDDSERGRGERLPARVVDVLLRRDGNHKLLAVPAGARLDVPVTLREEIMRYYVAINKPVMEWAGEDAAMEVIRACRAAGAASGAS